jgi:hypothetical protein
VRGILRAIKMTSPHKLRNLTMKELQREINLPEEQRDLIANGPSSPTLLNLLTERELLSEATRLLSYALPVREAVWWACMCVRHVLPLVTLPAEQEAALTAAEEWVRKPCIAERMKTHRACANAGYFTPAGWVAQAAFSSEMSISIPRASGGKVEKAVSLAAIYRGEDHQPERLKRFIVSGRDIATGGAGRLPPESPGIVVRACVRQRGGICAGAELNFGPFDQGRR